MVTWFVRGGVVTEEPEEKSPTPSVFDIPEEDDRKLFKHLQSFQRKVVAARRYVNARKYRRKPRKMDEERYNEIMRTEALRDCVKDEDIEKALGQLDLLLMKIFAGEQMTAIETTFFFSAFRHIVLETMMNK